MDSGYSDSADWLEGWASTPHEISSSDRTFKIFARSLTAGHAVSTGQWPIVDSHPANYVVMAVPGAALNLGAVADDLPVVDQPDSGDQVEADEPVEDDPVSQDPVVDAPDDSSDSDEPIDNTPDEADSEQPASNEELITPPNYQWSVLDTDRNVYVDRTYVYSEIPMGYVGFTSLMTANSDKISNNSSQIIFSVNRAVRVYVGVDSRRANAPSWLASWTDSDTQVETTDSIMDIYYRDYSSGLVVLGGNEGSVSGSNYIVFLGDKNSDSQTDDPADMQPVAVNDFVNVEAGGEAVVSVLANDREILDGPISVSLASQPRHGEVELVGSQFIYTADNDYDGADTFDYQLIDVDGDRSIATVILDVTCTDCVEKSVQINLSWNASSGRPDSYEVFVGASDDGLVNVSVPFKVVPESITSLSFDANEVAPQILSDRLCFRLRARNRGGVSDFSDAACVNL